MTLVAGQTQILISRWEVTPGGALVDLDATPTIEITNIGTAATVLAATTTAVTHPGTGVYGYVWSTDIALPSGSYLIEWAGLYLGSPATASETIMVLAAATAAAANTDPAGVWYCTIEDVRHALESAETWRSNQQIARAIEAGAREIEGPKQCARRFFPVDATRYWDWPARGVRGSSWRIDLDGGDELISLSSLVTGDGTTIADTDYFLEPRNSGPPYTSIEIDLASSAAFSAGSTYQRAVAGTGTFGFRLRWTAAGATAEALDASETGLNVDGAAAAVLGIGSLLLVDGERLLVTGRAALTTGQTVQTTALTASNANVTVLVTSGAAFGIGEDILIDSERMSILDIAGNALTVRRAIGGTVLAAHSTGVTIYGYRTLTVVRGALGTTAATHADATAIYRFEYPGPVHTLNVAEAMNTLLNEQAGYARTAGTGESQREVWGRALVERRRMARSACGRKQPYRGAI